MSFAIALAGANAAIGRLDTAAAEIAQQARYPGRQPETLPAPDSTIQAFTLSPGDNAGSKDLVASVVGQISASAAFLANMETIRRTDENLESLLRIS